MNERDQVDPVEQQGSTDGPRKLARRSFLMAAPLGALAVVVLRARRAQAAGAVVQAQPQSTRGYHETEHIRSYYRTASYW